MVDAFGRGVRVRRGRRVVVVVLAATSSSFELFIPFNGRRVLLVLRVRLVVVDAAVVLLTAGSIGPLSTPSSLMSSSTGITSFDGVGRGRRVRRVLLVVAIVVVVVLPLDSTITLSSSLSGASGDGSSVNGVVRVRRVRRGRVVDVVDVDKFIISTVIFDRIFSCVPADGSVDGVGRDLLVRRGRIVVVLLDSSMSAFHISYVSASGSTSLNSTLSYASSIPSSSAAATISPAFERDLLIRRMSLK